MNPCCVGLALGLGLGLAGPSLSALGAPELAISREGERITLTFSGALEAANTPAGPWLLVPGAVSPFQPQPSGDQRFYRSRQEGAKSIFDSRDVVELHVAGPLQEHFGLAHAGLPDGIFPPVREKPYFAGTVRVGGTEVPVSLRVRGNSSLQECPFPKLKFKVGREERAETPFFDAREVKIGTHCAEGGQGNVGRLRDERAAFREVLAFEVMDLLGFISPRVRRAIVEYQDTTAGDLSGDTGWRVRRQGFVFDHVEVVAERLGGRALSDEETAALTDAKFDTQLITDLQFLHALLGNWDYALSPGGQGIWNTEVIELPNLQLLPVAGDFDLASWVTAEVRLSAPRDYRPDLGDVERQVHFELGQIRDRVSPESFDAAAERFGAARAEIEAEVTAAVIDDEGRANAHRHVAAFFDALADQAGDGE